MGSVNTVRAVIARSMLGGANDPASVAPQGARVGGFTLRDDQVRALSQVRAALREFGGALVADRPGTGKTILALAIAAEVCAPRVTGSTHTSTTDANALVVAPAALRAQWAQAAERARVRIAFESLESLSRGRAPGGFALVIVDEAHQARTAGTRRYARLAAACFDARVLLLTATPVVNRARDRDALLALFLGARASGLTPDEISRCVVRGQDAADRPAVIRVGGIGARPELPGLATAIAALPPPLPLEAGNDARALVVMSLAMAWRSSLAALDVALRRRVQRGEALGDILRAGQLPSQALLRHWTLLDEATQLALPSLVASPTSPRHPHPDALRLLGRHVEAVRALRDRVRPHRAEDLSACATAILSLADAHPHERVVVFARHAETVRALYGVLRTRPGVVAIIGGRVFAAAGRWTRDEVLRTVGPRAKPLSADDPRTIRLLLATDVVSEGVEMHGIGIVVHADVPWTPARLEQRVGRVTRAGSARHDVLEAHLVAPRGVRRLLKLGTRLRAKRDARRHAVDEAAAMAKVATILRRWSVIDDGAAGAGTDAGEAVAACARVVHRSDAFIAVLQDGSAHRWIVGVRRSRHWRLSSAPRLVLRLLRAADDAEGHTDPGAIARAERLVARAVSRRAARALASLEPTSAAQRRLQQVRRRLARVLSCAPALARPALARAHAEWLRALGGPLETERERRIGELLRSEPDDLRFARRLGALLARRTPPDAHEPHRGPVRLVALLVLSPAVRATAALAPVPPSASPGTAAPR